MQKNLRGPLSCKAFLFILCFGLCFYTMRAQVSGTFTINAAQATGGTNFQTFNEAVAFMTGGVNGPVVFNVAPGSGPYNEQVIINSITGTSATNTITFNGNGDTLAFEPISSFESAVLKLNGADYVTIDSLNVKVLSTSSTRGFGIQMINDADHNTVKRCKIISSTSTVSILHAGIVINSNADEPRGISNFSYCDSNTITRNTVIGGFYGITCASDANYPSKNPGVTWCEGNIITNNVIEDACSFGIWVGGTTNTLIEHNDISQPTRKTVVIFYGIYSYLENYGLRVSKNKIHNISENSRLSNIQVDAIHFEKTSCLGATPNMVCNNLVYNIHGTGWQYGIYSISSNYVKFYNNTILLEDTASTTSIVVTRGFGLFGTDPTGTEFKNNNVIIRRAGPGTRTCIYLGITNSALVPDYNNLLIEGPTCTSTSCYIGHRGTNSGTNHITLADWTTIGKDVNSISMDPVYKDPLNADFSPTRIPFDNRGTVVSVTDDILDESRSATKPDIGAFEFTICKDLITPVLSVDSFGSYTVRFTWTAVPNTPAYLVSRDGITWTTPSSGPLGLTHTINGLKARDTLGLMVKAIGTRWDCPPVYSNRVKVQTVSDQVYIPNTFTPNGNGQNDVFKVYSNIVKRLHLMVFNQWGEKVFETTDIKGSWDGMYKGKPQAVGVYVYVAVMELADNSKVTHKGTFNLIR